ncbi:hypothetical protein L6452_19232 [Arctium lappa]|uniref:Uncharacterized protein n=1 Tax=Arctium lappa TaxID=4217 RepID=A0ACB9B8T8_ARCLA|nr:hypothetical protein L6452_19232 [Arctium lappa]
MANAVNYFSAGSQSKPPTLIIDEYPNWKIRMVHFLEGVDPGLVEFLHNPPFIPMTTVPRVPATANTSEIPEYQHPKPVLEWSEEEKAQHELAKKAKRLIIMAIPNDLFQSLDSSTLDLDVWSISDLFGTLISHENRIFKLTTPVGGPLALVGSASEGKDKEKKEKAAEEAQRKKKKKKVLVAESESEENSEEEIDMAALAKTFALMTRQFNRGLKKKPEYRGREERDDRRRRYGETRRHAREKFEEPRQEERSGQRSDDRGSHKFPKQTEGCFKCGKPGPNAAECRSSANNGNPTTDAAFYKKKAEYYTQRSLMAEQENLVTDESSDEEDNTLFCGMAEVHSFDNENEESTSNSCNSNFENKLLEIQNDLLAYKNTCSDLQKKLAFFERETRLLTEEKDKLYLENKSLTSEHISTKRGFKEKISNLYKALKEKMANVRNCPLKPQSLFRPPWKKNFLKDFWKNDLRKTYENHFLNHPDIISEVKEIFKQDIQICLSVPKITPCFTKEINTSKDTNGQSKAHTGQDLIHRYFLDSDSESESESSVKDETGSVKLEIVPCDPEKNRLTSGILNRTVIPKKKSTGIPICPDFLDMCLQAKTSIELKKYEKDKISHDSKTPKPLKPFQEKLTWKQKDKWPKIGKLNDSVAVKARKEDQRRVQSKSHSRGVSEKTQPRLDKAFCKTKPKSKMGCSKVFSVPSFDNFNESFKKLSSNVHYCKCFDLTHALNQHFSRTPCLISHPKSKNAKFKGEKRQSGTSANEDKSKTKDAKASSLPPNKNGPMWKWGQIKGYEVIAKGDIDVNRVAYVDGLKHNFLSMLHVDLCGSISVQSLGGKKYILVLIDEFSRYTWVEFVRKKSDVPEVLINLINIIQVLYNCRVQRIRSDNGTEFRNSTIEAYLSREGISQNFSAARTPQQNGVVERKNRTLVEAARTMLTASGISISFWAEAISTACFTQNRSLIVKRHAKTPYHLLHQTKPNIKYFHVFGYRCFMLNDREQIRKFSPKGDEAKFVGYSSNSKAYKVFVLKSKQILESINVSVYDSFQVTSEQINSGLKLQDEDSGGSSRTNDLHHLFKEMFNDDGPTEGDRRASEAEPSEDQTGTSLTGPSNASPSSSNAAGATIEGEHSRDNVNQGSKLSRNHGHPQNLSEGSTPDQGSAEVSTSIHVEQPSPAANTNDQFLSTENDLNQDEHAPELTTEVSNDHLPRLIKWTRSHPQSQVIGDPSDKVQTRSNTANFCYYINFVSIIEPKKISEALEDPNWVEAMQEDFLQFERNEVWTLTRSNKNLSCLRSPQRFQSISNGCQVSFLNGQIQEEVCVQQPPGFENSKYPNHVYFLDKALYGLKQAPRAWYDRLSNFLLANGFERDLEGKSVECKLYRGMIGSLLYLTASRPDIMFATSVCARFEANPKESHLHAVKGIFRYLKWTKNLGLCWTSKKQNCVSTSTTEAEYVAVASCCSEVLWMRTQLRDYGFDIEKIPILFDSKSAIAISANPVQHSKTKHIDIRYHFLKHHVEHGTIEMYFVPTDYQLADLFTKALDEKRFTFLVGKIEPLESTAEPLRSVTEDVRPNAL